MAGVATMTSQTIVRPLPSARRGERLGDDALQAVGQLGADLLLLVRREDVDQPVDGLRRGLRVQGGQHQVAGLGGGDRDRGRLEVAQLADQDDVGVLAQHVPQGVGKSAVSSPTSRWLTTLAAVRVQVLDRVLDRS